MTGTTCSGKTTILKKLLKETELERYKIALSEDVIIDEYFPYIGSKSNRFLKIFLVDLILLTEVFNHKIIHLSYLFSKFIFRSKQGFFIKLNLLRNVVKRLCLHKKLNKIKDNLNYDIIFIDEGTMHIAHNIFINFNMMPSEEELNEFSLIIPKYDKIFLIETPKEKILSNIKQRKYGRISNKTENMELLIENSVKMYSDLRIIHSNDNSFITFELKNNINTMPKILKALKKILND